MSESWKDDLRRAGNEYGAATGRPRRVGPFDAVASRYGLQCQNADRIALTKLDDIKLHEGNSDYHRIPAAHETYYGF